MFPFKRSHLVAALLVAFLAISLAQNSAQDEEYDDVDQVEYDSADYSENGSQSIAGQPIVKPVGYAQPQPVSIYPASQVLNYSVTPVVIPQSSYPQQPSQVYSQVYSTPTLNYSIPTIVSPQPVYTQPQPQVYTQTAPTYSTPPVVNYTVTTSPQSSYVQPQPPVYSIPQVLNYSVSQTYQISSGISIPDYQTTNYQAPHPTPNYPAQVVPTPVVQSYQKPISNYSIAPVKPPYPLQQVPVYQQVLPVGKYMGLELLTPFLSFNGYRANYPSLFYYRSSPYRSCPKSQYLNGPSIQDIQAAFVFAQQQLSAAQGASIQYINSTQPNYASRHHVFSFLNQRTARADEEGLLIELVSQYLSERACMTKWDKQRYLPQLTQIVSTSNFPPTHSCFNYYQTLQHGGNLSYCAQSKYRSIDGFCNNLYHPYWGKSNVCHIRLLSPDYGDGISSPRTSYNPSFPLPSARTISNIIHHDVPLESQYNQMKMQWGQFINHDITNTALSSYDGLIDCCQNPNIRGCWPIYVPPGDRFYGPYNVTCLNFIRSGVCPICQLGPRQQMNKNTAFLDLSLVYGNTLEQARPLRAFVGGQLKFSIGKNGEILLPVANGQQEQCSGSCFTAGDNRVNQHPAMTVMHTLALRSHNYHARALAAIHHDWSDELIFQEARRINIAEYQMITYTEYLPIVFGPILTAYFKFLPTQQYTYYDPKADPTTWNEYSTAACRFGHSQIQSTFGLYSTVFGHRQIDPRQPSYRLGEWYFRPSLLTDGQTREIVNGLMSAPASAVDPWIADDVRNYLYRSHKEPTGGDLAATNIWRGRDHGIPGYIHYLEYCFNYKVHSWRDLHLFIPHYTVTQLRKVYKVVENIDLFTGGISERHYPGADIGPTFACINGIQYYHLKFGDRYYFEHGGQAGSFNPIQLAQLKKATLARFICRTANVPAVPRYAFLAASPLNPLVSCSSLEEIDYRLF